MAIDFRRLRLAVSEHRTQAQGGYNKDELDRIALELGVTAAPHALNRQGLETLFELNSDLVRRAERRAAGQVGSPPRVVRARAVPSPAQAQQAAAHRRAMDRRLQRLMAGIGAMGPDQLFSQNRA